MDVGACYLGDGKCDFVVWAPHLQKVDLQLSTQYPKTMPMEKDEKGYWRTNAQDISADTLYSYVLESEKSRPDPASYFQPHGVHQASQVVNHKAFDWEDSGWRGIELSKMVMYELHIGTFSPQGTFDGVIPRLDDLKDLGVNAIEIMPVAQIPGERNWGYDGVYPYAVQNSYGGPQGLKNLVNECHKKGMAVILDVVYNHLGPEGNYLADFAPYFTDTYKTPWGWAINYDGPFSDEVRNYFVGNALYWLRHYHVDALRIDAVHAIYDMSARPFLQELAEQVDEFSRADGRKRYLIAESDLNDSRMIRPWELGGYGHDAQWSDDLHHCIHAILTGENDGYYQDFGTLEQLVASLKEGFVYSGQYSEHRKRRHGNSCKDRPASQFVVFSQNHDQVGNRMLGERLSSLVSFEALKLAASIEILSPYVPLLFMGEEYAEDTPFLYFVSHSEPSLIAAVRKGRRDEFADFVWTTEPPDPQDLATFERSKLNWEKRSKEKHRVMLEYYKFLLKMRKETAAFSHLDKDALDVTLFNRERVVTMQRLHNSSRAYVIFNFSSSSETVGADLPGGRWGTVLDSADTIWNGPGTLIPTKINPRDQLKLQPHSVAVFKKES
jgi:maltooligosyltrehalose trehalohydrolase